MVMHSTLNHLSHPLQQTHNPSLSVYATPHLGQIDCQTLLLMHWTVAVWQTLPQSAWKLEILFLCFFYSLCVSLCYPFSFVSPFLPSLSSSVQLAIISLLFFEFSPISLLPSPFPLQPFHVLSFLIPLALHLP